MFIVIDGFAGSGKTSLAGQIADSLGNCNVVHLDDLYAGWDGLFEPSLETRITDIVRQWQSQSLEISFQTFNWLTSAFESVHSLQRMPHLIVEGVGASVLTQAVGPDIVVWCDSDPVNALRRVIARDGAAVATHMKAWQDDEQRFFANKNPRWDTRVCLIGD